MGRRVPPSTNLPSFFNAKSDAKKQRERKGHSLSTSQPKFNKKTTKNTKRHEGVTGVKNSYTRNKRRCFGKEFLTHQIPFVSLCVLRGLRVERMGDSQTGNLLCALCFFALLCVEIWETLLPYTYSPCHFQRHKLIGCWIIIRNLTRSDIKMPTM